MKDLILQKIEQIEKDNDITIIFACESGSRAWGFESLNSDYDVRFIYVSPLKRYLSIENHRDVIEVMDGDLDFAGWDIKKALFLFKKSNPPLLEWLQSPIVYKKDTKLMKIIESKAQEVFSPKSCIHHYLHMADGNYYSFLKKEQVIIKKYFYVLRPILCCNWIEMYNQMPPMEFEKLLVTLNDQNVLKEIKNLLILKKTGEELGMSHQVIILNNYIEERFSYFSSYAQSIPQNQIESEKINDLFLNILSIMYSI